MQRKNVKLNVGDGNLGYGVGTFELGLFLIT